MISFNKHTCHILMNPQWKRKIRVLQKWKTNIALTEKSYVRNNYSITALIYHIKNPREKKMVGIKTKRLFHIDYGRIRKIKEKWQNKGKK